MPKSRLITTYDVATTAWLTAVVVAIKWLEDGHHADNNDDEDCQHVHDNDDENGGRRWAKSRPKGCLPAPMEARAGSSNRWCPKASRWLGSRNLIRMKVPRCSTMAMIVTAVMTHPFSQIINPNNKPLLDKIFKTIK